MNTPVDPKAAEATASPAEAQQLPAVIPDRQREVRVVIDPIAVLDTARFEQMQRVANVMANCNFIPDALCTMKVGDKLEPLDRRAVLSNCFMVVNQAVRWGMDPFAVAQCVSVVHGKLCYEGKLIAGLIDAKLGIRLHYEWSGEGENMRIRVSGTFKDGVTETIEGSVKEWKTNHKGSPWTPLQYRKMLAYRGAREWARLYAPGLMLGVYSPDEMDALSDDSRASNARDVTIRDDDVAPATAPRRPRPPPPPVTDAPTTSPAGESTPAAATATTEDTSYVDLVADKQPDARPEAEQPRSEAAGQASPAAPSRSTPAAGEVISMKARLLKSLGEVDSVLKLEAWLDENGRDMADLEGPDQREVESAFNKREHELRNPKKK